MIVYPEIEPLPPDTTRPLWSVMIPTYNGTQYLEQTLRSVLEQDPGSEQMQIEVIDDCSTKDDPEKLVEQIGQGRVAFHRQAKNLGQIATWNHCIDRARGHWVHILHQDDIVLPGFYQQLEQATEADEKIGAAFCRHVTFDEDGHWQEISCVERKTPGILDNWLPLIATYQRVQFASIVVKRETYERVGGFCPQAYSASDWEMWKRIAAHTEVWYEPKILACFRMHNNSETSRLARLATNIAHIRCAIDVSDSYLPQPIRKALTNEARERYALTALSIANGAVNKRELNVAIAHMREALKCSSSWKVIRQILKLTTKIGIKTVAF